jgi:hypothetical protein
MIPLLTGFSENAIQAFPGKTGYFPKGAQKTIEF